MIVGNFFEAHGILPCDLVRMTFPQLNSIGEYYEKKERIKAHERGRERAKKLLENVTGAGGLTRI